MIAAAKARHSKSEAATRLDRLTSVSIGGSGHRTRRVGRPDDPEAQAGAGSAAQKLGIRRRPASAMLLSTAGAGMGGAALSSDAPSRRCPHWSLRQA